MREEVRAVLEKYPYYKGRFIDVYGIGLGRCYNPGHSLPTFEDVLEVKKTAFRNLKDMSLIVGTEDGFEDLIDELVYTEGLHSPVCFRNKEAGRRHKNMYDADEEQRIEKYMLNPECRVPLFEILYHENLLTFPYWGDSTDDSINQGKKKVLFACLFGCQPLYSFSLGNYEKLKPLILSSYKKISRISKYTVTEPITAYRVLSDDFSLQQTEFGNRYRVTANFSKNAQSVNGKVIPPENLVFERL